MELFGALLASCCLWCSSEAIFCREEKMVNASARKDVFSSVAQSPAKSPMRFPSGWVCNPWGCRDAVGLREEDATPTKLIVAGLERKGTSSITLRRVQAAPQHVRQSNKGPLFLAATTIMLRWLLVQNRQGKSRLAKFYVPLDDDEKVRLKGEIHRLVAPRDQKYQSNFVEVRMSSRVVVAR